MTRFKIVEESQSAHCCFEYTVVDTTVPDLVPDRFKSACECFDRESAETICRALNEVEIASPANCICGGKVSYGVVTIEKNCKAFLHRVRPR